MRTMGRIAAFTLVAAASLFAANASAAPGDIRAAPVSIGTGADPDVAAMPDGGALHVWIGSEGATPSDAVYSLRARRYAANGAAGPARKLDANLGNAVQPRVAADGAGDFAVGLSQRAGARKSVLWGKRVYVRVDHGGG